MSLRPPTGCEAGNHAFTCNVYESVCIFCGEKESAEWKYSAAENFEPAKDPFEEALVEAMSTPIRDDSIPTNGTVFILNIPDELKEE